MITPEPRRRLAPAARRIQILNAALELFEKQSFQSVSMRQIATGCQVNIALLYHYFDNKEALVRDSLLHAVEGFLASVPLDADPEAKPLGMASFWLDATILSTPLLLRMVRLMHDYAAAGGNDPEVIAIVDHFYACERSTFERAIAEGITRGVFRKVDVERTARLASMTLDGIFYSGPARGDVNYAAHINDLHDQLIDYLSLRSAPL